MRDALTITKTLLDGGTIDYAGSVFEAKSVKLEFECPHVPVYVGTYASSTKMLELAATLADGVILMWTNPQWVKKAVKVIENKARSVGRDPSTIDVAAYLIFSVDEDQAKAKTVCEQVLKVYEPRLRDVWMKHSLIPETTSDHGNELQRPSGANLVESIAIAGTPRYCIERLEEYSKAGLKTPIFYQILGPNRNKAIKVIAEEIIPSF